MIEVINFGDIGFVLNISLTIYGLPTSLYVRKSIMVYDSVSEVDKVNEIYNGKLIFSKR